MVYLTNHDRNYCQFCRRELQLIDERKHGFHLSCSKEVLAYRSNRPATTTILHQEVSLRSTSLHLANYDLTTVPSSLGLLSHLQNLNLSHNQLTTLPQIVGELTNLRSLNAGFNHIAEFDESLSNLHLLQNLYLADNRLRTLPDWFGTLTNLSRINLRSNPLVSVGEELIGLPNLSYLNLRGTGLGRDDLPYELRKKESLWVDE